MKLEILQENLIKILSVTARIISSRPQIPILSHVLLNAQNGTFEITASNTETTIIAPVGAKVESEGNFTVPARTFQDLVSSLPPEKISLETSDSQLKIKSVNFSGKINGTAASEYPSLTSPQSPKNNWRIDSLILSSIISKTLFACATDESRAILTGLLLKPEKDSLIVAATDGFRLSRFEIKNLTLGDPIQSSVVIPAKSLVELFKLLSEKNEEKSVPVNISFLDNGQVLFNFNEIRIYSRLIAGNFPEFEKIIPSESTIQLVVSIEELSKAVRLASIFARESANIVKLTIEGAKLKISANAVQVGENESDIDIDLKKDSGESFQIAFNYRYLLDFLGSLGKDNKISLEFTTPLAPGVFRLEGNLNYLHLIMPVRVQS